MSKKEILLKISNLIVEIGEENPILVAELHEIYNWIKSH